MNDEKKDLTICMDFTFEEKQLADTMCQNIIDSMKNLNPKVKWLVVNTLKDSFPVGTIKKYFEVKEVD